MNAVEVMSTGNTGNPISTEEGVCEKKQIHVSHTRLDVHDGVKEVSFTITTME